MSNSNNSYADSYTTKIFQNKITLDSLLTEFRTIYFLYKTNPGNDEYRQQYNNIKTSINNVLQTIFEMSNDLNSKIDYLNNRITEINTAIVTEKNRTMELKNQLGINQEKSSAAGEMTNDYKNIYDIRYLRNWGIALSILGLIATSRILYNSNTSMV
jgi:hypothetical protein